MKAKLRPFRLYADNQGGYILSDNKKIRIEDLRDNTVKELSDKDYLNEISQILINNTHSDSVGKNIGDRRQGQGKQLNKKQNKYIKDLNLAKLSQKDRSKSLVDILRHITKKGNGNDAIELPDDGMYDYQIIELLDRFGIDENVGFLGVFSADEWPEIIDTYADLLDNGTLTRSDRISFILNTDVKAGPGIHWVSVFIDPSVEREVDYYDPLAQPIPAMMSKGLKQLYDVIAPETLLKFKESSVRHQRADSNECGLFAIDFLLRRYSGKPFNVSSGYSGGSVNKSESKIIKFKNRLKKFGYII